MVRHDFSPIPPFVRLDDYYEVEPIDGKDHKMVTTPAAVLSEAVDSNDTKPDDDDFSTFAQDDNQIAGPMAPAGSAVFMFPFFGPYAYQRLQGTVRSRSLWNGSFSHKSRKN